MYDEANRMQGLCESILDHIHKSTNLRKIIEVILCFGNFLNHNNKAKGGAYGFHLDTLRKLMNVKACTDSSITMMHVLYTTMEKHYKESLDGFFKEFASIGAACRVEGPFLEGEIARR